MTRGTKLECTIDGCVAELRPRDLSLAGVFVPSPVPMEVDRELEITLRSPIGELVVRGQVVQVVSFERAAAEHRRAGFGVLFIDLGDDHRAFIGLTLDALLRHERASAAAAAPASGTRTKSKAPAAPPDPATKALAAERARTLKQLERELAALREKTPCAILGIAPDAGPEAARHAFLLASKRVHPHVYARLDSPQISALATEIFIAHKRALTKLQAGPRSQPTSVPIAPRSEARSLAPVASRRPQPLASPLPASPRSGRPAATPISRRPAGVRGAGGKALAPKDE